MTDLSCRVMLYSPLRMPSRTWANQELCSRSSADVSAVAGEASGFLAGSSSVPDDEVVAGSLAEAGASAKGRLVPTEDPATSTTYVTQSDTRKRAVNAEISLRKFLPFSTPTTIGT